jgi:predicted MFS family arabinose efflux permease
MRSESNITNHVPARRLLLVLCLVAGATTASIGAFPALLPEIGAAGGLADWQLGAVAGAFGFARMLADVPVGLFITHRLGRALRLAPLVLLAGAALLASGGGFATLLLGRAMMGAGHTLTTLAGLTAILRHRAGHRLASSLAAFELSAMLGILAGAALVGALPRSIPWNAAFLVPCVPTVAAITLLPMLQRLLPAAEPAAVRPLFARAVDAAPERGSALASSLPFVGLLAGVAGAVIAVSYSTGEQFLIPIRGSREFGLDRAGIARLLILGQTVDILALLPLGVLADRRGAPRVLGVVLLTFALALALLGFGDLPFMAAGCALFGLGMAGWTLPLGVLRSVTPAGQVAWRTALYRVAVDGAVCLGPLLAGVLTARHARILPAVLVGLLATTGIAFLAGIAVAPSTHGGPVCADGGSGSSAPSGC